jgi:hypothetical protein
VTVATESSLEGATPSLLTIYMICKHCQEEIETDHKDNHPGLCCDCFDLSLGMPLALLNRERKGKGLPPLKAWPSQAE